MPRRLFPRLLLEPRGVFGFGLYLRFPFGAPRHAPCSLLCQATQSPLLELLDRRGVFPLVQLRRGLPEALVELVGLLLPRRVRRGGSPGSVRLRLGGQLRDRLWMRRADQVF